MRKNANNVMKPIIGPSFQLMSNWCSMACAGCGIKVAAPLGNEVVDIDKKHLRNAKLILSNIRSSLERNNYHYALVEQSGGEPTHHPMIVEAIGETFPDCIHKIITNGLPSASIFNYLKRIGDRALLVISLDHNMLEYNQLRLGSKYRTNPSYANHIHNTVLRNLDLFASANVTIIVSSIISKWNVLHYLDFVAWLEYTYPNQIAAGTLVPIPVSIVSFGNASIGNFNPTLDQVIEFEKCVMQSNLISVKRSKDWLYFQLINHYYQKFRYFLKGEDLDSIEQSPSRFGCDIYRYMISFNFQDEEVLRPSSKALFQGFICGVKALGNIGNPILEKDYVRTSLFRDRPNNLSKEHKYFKITQIDDYLSMRDNIINSKRTIQMGSQNGFFVDLRRGMCLLDDFDGVWWPLNMYIQGKVKDVELGEYCKVFRNSKLISCLNSIRNNQISTN